MRGRPCSTATTGASAPSATPTGSGPPTRKTCARRRGCARVEHVDRIREPHRIGAWLAQVARNECLRAIRHRARVTTYADELEHRISDPAPAPDALMVAAERREAVRGAVKKLSPRDRAFLGRVFDDHEPSYAEIGHALRMPIGSIGPTRGRVLERMRRNAQLATLVATG